MKEPRIRNILVPIDFSKMSNNAIKTASRLARRFGASIHLAHVRQFDYAAGFSAPAPPFAPFPLMRYEQDEEKRTVKELNTLARESGVSSGICHVLGGAPPFNEVCRVAEKIPADLVVMPTHGRTGLKHVFLGSTAERIVQHSPCPVLVTRGSALHSKNGLRFRINRILVPVDFSSRSREGLQYAIGFANEFGAKIILLHATYLGYIYSIEATALYDVRGLQEAARESAQRQMRKLVRTVNFGRAKYEMVFTNGSPALDICAFARDHAIDLIITSTHGLTGFQHVLIGSIAEKVVRHAPCSVLVVPSHPQIRAANLAKTRVTKPRALANSPRRIRPVANQHQPRKSPRDKVLTKRGLKLAMHAFPERRMANKFRESHSS
jgi:nucleotide-binding universal stress UspA family protein